MKVIIPAAGRGSRLRPHTYSVPKVLLPVAGKPILGHILDQVIGWGGDEFTIVVGHFEDQIESYVTENYDVNVNFRHQQRLLGLGHAVLTGIEDNDKDILIILGDTILDADLTEIIRSGKSAMGVKKVDDPRKMGVVLVKESKVVKLIEKPVNPPSNLAIVGVYYLRDAMLLKSALEEVIKKKVTIKGEYQITDALQLMIDWGEAITTFPVSGWYDCGKPDTLLATNRYLLDRSDHVERLHNFPNSIIIPPVSIGVDAWIENSVIGPYVSIGPGAVIRQSLIGTRGEVQGHYRQLNIGASNQIEL